MSICLSMRSGCVKKSRAGALAGKDMRSIRLLPEDGINFAAIEAWQQTMAKPTFAYCEEGIA